MRELVYGPIADALATAVYALGAGALTAVGLLAERAGVENLAAGHLPIGAWEAYMGALALYVGVYLLGYREVWPRLRAGPGAWD